MPVLAVELAGEGSARFPLIISRGKQGLGLDPLGISVGGDIDLFEGFAGALEEAKAGNRLTACISFASLSSPLLSFIVSSMTELAAWLGFGICLVRLGCD